MAKYDVGEGGSAPTVVSVLLADGCRVPAGAHTHTHTHVEREQMERSAMTRSGLSGTP